MIIEKLQLDSQGKPVRNARGTLVMETTREYKGNSLEIAVNKYFPGGKPFEGIADSPLELVVCDSQARELGMISLSIDEYILTFNRKPNFGDGPGVY